jgi:hypothetical protein
MNAFEFRQERPQSVLLELESERSINVRRKTAPANAPPCFFQNCAVKRERYLLGGHATILLRVG